MKKTIWEHIKSFFITPPPQEIVEKKYFNPLNCKLNHKITLNILDYDNKIYNVDSIIVYDRMLNNKTIQMTDYYLSVADQQKRLILRAFPKERYGDFGYVLLETYYDCDDHEARKEILIAANDPTGEFYIDRDQPTEMKFWKIYKSQPLLVDSTVLEDLDGNGVLEANEVRKTTHSFWAFMRETVDKDNITVTEYLWVQLSGTYVAPDNIEGGSKDLIVLRGYEVPGDRVRN